MKKLLALFGLDPVFDHGKAHDRVHILDQPLYHLALENLMSEDYWR